MTANGSDTDVMPAGLPAVLGGRPLAHEPLRIVRPKLPPLAAVAERFAVALASGTVTNQGPFARALEDRLAAWLGVTRVAVTSCGQSALMLMLRAVGVDGGEVIVPSFTFSATPHAVRWCGAAPVFADTAAGTFGLDPAAAEARITSRTAAIVGVDTYGIPCDYSGLEDVARRRRLPLVLDSAPAFGARIDGGPIGARGRAQAFSFHATKAFSTMEGGCVTSVDADLVARVAALRNFGQTHGADCDEPGINAKMTELCAVVGLEQLDSLSATLDRRAAVAERYRRGLDRVEGLHLPTVAPHVSPAWLYYPIIVDPPRFGLHRDTLVAALASEALFPRTYYSPPCHRLTCYAGAGTCDLPNTEFAAANVVALPVYSDMTDHECDLFVGAIARIRAHASAIRRRFGLEAPP